MFLNFKLQGGFYKRELVGVYKRTQVGVYKLLNSTVWFPNGVSISSKIKYFLVEKSFNGVHNGVPIRS